MKAVSNKVEVIGNVRCSLGETPVWCSDSQSLLWVDILQQQLLRYWPEQGGRTEIHPLPAATSAILLTNQPETFLAVSQCGIKLYDYPTRHFTLIHPWPEEESATRPNESAIAPDGALWFSSMDPDAKRTIGSWYCLKRLNAPLQRMLTGQGIPNTLQWHEGYIWFADSLRQRFYCGTESAQGLRIIREYAVDGIADGSALTTEGTLINARWGEGKLVCSRLHQTQMTSSEEVKLPVTQPTSCTFGGPELNTLFITSARDGLPHPGSSDGALLAIKTTHKGVLANRFIL